MNRAALLAWAVAVALGAAAAAVPACGNSQPGMDAGDAGREAVSPVDASPEGAPTFFVGTSDPGRP